MSILSKLKKIPTLRRFVLLVSNRIFFGNRFRFHKKSKTKLIIHDVLMKNCSITINGSNNTILIGARSRCENCQFFINGDNNIISIGENSGIKHTVFAVEDNDNEIRIGKCFTVEHHSHFGVIESTKLIVGDDCMFSSYVDMRTGDSHSILNAQNERMNSSKDIVVGNHVWMGMNVICLKGSQIGDNSVVGAMSLVNESTDIPPGSVAAGNPARLIRSGVSWKRERISISKSKIEN